ncbi:MULTISPECIES: hypothetical protein [Streptomyces]|uniref:Uncharacterized protein n=1 Tax=Streptomyces glycanivorans TaxID=3033808 RepID=A0ABY9J331_9ACTN|nr:MULTISPECIES: hypothetical protein [unclassified Streptomyces]WSQ75587.1 hypothetical protein OG725_00165 [Streptomyces sp. NBC_01213]WLQ62078.1 hypothetical protein P8A20_00055 [Streptomyces sp. Alt3]WLQ68797.1 hypothetical protein P8A20_37050 [Streptomyces sp. Alt3]WSQ82153.1 hypothetical protein OG725_36025 [Streptomyces sp. NBC_01213]WSQ82838.1 hypothetical protein OG722_00155 [Streptomyces sp. NBC_01212]
MLNAEHGSIFRKLIHPSLLEFGRRAKGKPGIVQKQRRNGEPMFDIDVAIVA